MSTKRTLAQTHFVINAPQERVWRLMGSAVFQCLPLEQIDVSDQNHFSAILRLQFGPIKVPVSLKATLDMTPQTSFGTTIELTKWILKMGNKVEMTLKPTSDGKTEIDCIATDDGKGSIIGLVTRGKQRAFSEGVFSSIKARLEQLC